MSVRDLIPWSRGNNQAPSIYRDERWTHSCPCIGMSTGSSTKSFEISARPRCSVV